MSERSFSTLSKLKTYLRNTVGENRPNDLALMNIHRDIPISTTEVIDKLIAFQCRRLSLKIHLGNQVIISYHLS